MSLRTIVPTILATRQPTCIFWGPELVNLYNDGFVPLLGEKHPRAMGQSARECWSDAWPVVGELLNNVVKRGEAVLFAEMLVPIVRRGELEDAWWNYSYSPLFDDSGAIAGVLVVATETTEQVAVRRQLETARSEADLARKEMQAVFMQAPLPMALLKGPEHRFVLVNGPYCALVNRDVVGKTLHEAFNDQEAGFYRPALDLVFSTGEPQVLKEAPLRLADASGQVKEHFIDVGFHAFRDPDGSVVGVLAVIHDVTSLVVARMREAGLRMAAESANLAKEEFLATVSHELRTPLNAILGWSVMLQSTREPHKLEKGLAVIQRNAASQATLIDDILDMSRIVTGKLILSLRRVTLSSVVENAVESARPAAAAKRIAVEVSSECPAVELIADEDRLQQIVGNLLSNAVKFTPESGRVRVSTRQDGSRVVIRVEDTGRGIPGEFLAHVFERFRQRDGSSTKRHGGVGLGLAIVRHLAELHGGTVSVHSEGEGKGARFEVVLPVTAVNAGSFEHRDSQAPLWSQEDVPARADSLHGLRVLVVDDERDARELVATVLSDAGAHVTEVASVASALQALASAAERFDVLVSDIGMPDEDGLSLMRRLRSEGALVSKNLPALALTAYARPEDRRQALAAGYQQYAAKPIEPNVLVRAVALLARR